MVVVLSILLGLLFLRLLLPHMALYVINKKLSRVKGYGGHINKITINLLRGSYSLHDIVFHKNNSDTYTQEPFFTAPRIDLLIQWRTLFKKSLVATVVIEQPELNLVKEKSEPAREEKSPSLRTLLQGVLPFTVHLGIKGGAIHYIDTISRANVDLEITDLTVCIRDFSNKHEFSPSYINASARVYQGTFDFTMQLYPMAEHLTFDMNAELKNINLVLMNEFFRTYVKIDVNHGWLDMYTEVAAKGGGFKGYVKPVIRELDVVGAEDRNDNLFRKLWEGFVAGVYQVIKNKKADQVATKIPIEGRLDDPHINIFIAVLTIFQNAFFRAMRPSLDDVIDMASVRTSVSKARGFVNGMFRQKKEKV